MSTHPLRLLREHFNLERSSANVLLQQSGGNLGTAIAALAPRAGGHDPDTLRLFVSILNIADAVSSQWNGEVDNLRAALVHRHIRFEAPKSPEIDIQAQYLALLTSLSIDKRDAPEFPAWLKSQQSSVKQYLLPKVIATFISGVRALILRKVVAEIQQAMPVVSTDCNGTPAQRMRLDGLRCLARATQCQLMNNILGLHTDGVDAHIAHSMALPDQTLTTSPHLQEASPSSALCHSVRWMVRTDIQHPQNHRIDQYVDEEIMRLQQFVSANEPPQHRMPSPLRPAPASTPAHNNGQPSLPTRTSAYTNAQSIVSARMQDNRDLAGPAHYHQQTNLNHQQHLDTTHHSNQHKQSSEDEGLVSIVDAQRAARARARRVVRTEYHKTKSEQEALAHRARRLHQLQQKVDEQRLKWQQKQTPARPRTGRTKSKTNSVNTNVQPDAIRQAEATLRVCMPALVGALGVFCMRLNDGLRKQICICTQTNTHA